MRERRYPVAAMGLHGVGLEVVALLGRDARVFFGRVEDEQLGQDDPDDAEQARQVEDGRPAAAEAVQAQERRDGERHRTAQRETGEGQSQQRRPLVRRRPAREQRLDRRQRQTLRFFFGIFVFILFGIRPFNSTDQSVLLGQLQ